MRKIISLLMLSCSLLSTQVNADEYWCFEDGAFSLSGDFLYWKSKQDNLKYTTQPLPVATSFDFTDSELISPHSEWKPAYRIVVDYSFANTGWSAELQYTQYNGSAHGTEVVSDSEGIFPVLSFASTTLPTDYVTSARSHWRLNTYLLDMIAVYERCFGDRFALTPTVAIRNTWITQNVHATYLGGTFSAGPDEVYLESKFYGIGPRIGLTPSLNLGYGLTLYGEAAGSLLYGWFNVHQNETFLSVLRDSLHRQTQGIRWNADLIAGLKWGYCADECSVIKKYSIDFGADYLYFSDQYAFKHGAEFVLPTDEEHLTLYGIHVSVGLEF